MTTNNDIQFPDNFLWGAATASYQIEGAANEDGRGESIWDRFSHTPGKTQDGDTGDIACDHYHRWQDDIQLMQTLGLQTYRFSIAWPRIVPNGRGQINQAGLDFYSQLVDRLLDANIIPCATLYHWDLPQMLQDAGGWASRDIVSAYTEYADIMTRHLGDRVNFWATFNEPGVFAYLGNLSGEHAPGYKDVRQSILVAHHTLLAHGKTIPIIRQNVPDAKVGIVIAINEKQPATDSVADETAVTLINNLWNNMYLGPLAGHGYPESNLHLFRTQFGDEIPFIRSGDMDVMSAPIDFLGINYYTRAIVSHDTIHDFLQDQLPQDKTGATLNISGNEFTEMGWEVYPEGLYNVLHKINNEYGFPELYITENGAATNDHVAADGHVHDEQRLSYLKRHFAQANRAIQEGVPLKGYFVWSLLDNFEWAFGYSKRFGLIHVDYETQKRTLKNSALWYQNVIKQNGFDV
ncbi:MAG: beta-glucosidase [Chloroflexi bacterium]|nr:beta-glucosidase [Chloroflexota bacterium]